MSDLRRTPLFRDMPDPYHDPILFPYLKSVEAWHGYVRFLGMPHLNDALDEPLEQLFVETYVHHRYIHPEEPPETWAKDRRQLVDVVAEKKHVLLLGDPGAGKSTLLNWVAWNYTRWDAPVWIERLGPLLPIPLVIRELPINRLITWDKLLNLFLAHGVARDFLTRPLLDQLIHSRRVFFLVDGLDEISDLETRQQLRAALMEGMNERAQDCPWLLTSRIVGYDEVPYDLAEPETALTDELPTLRGQSVGHAAYALTHRPRANLARVYCCPFDDAQINRFALNWFASRDSRSWDVGKEMMERFVRDLRTSGAPAALARIPNLLAMIALVYRVLGVIPDGRSKLYAKVAEAYLESIDTSRGMKPRFTRERMERWLAFIAFHMQRRRAAVHAQGDTKTREILLPRAELVHLLTRDLQALGDAPTPAEAEEFLEFVARRSGLLLPRGEGQFAFMHLSFQEYFAARFLYERLHSLAWMRASYVVEGIDPKALQDYSKTHVWRECLVLLFEMLSAEWAEELLGILYGPWLQQRTPTYNKDDHAPYVRLVTELALDPHVPWPDHRRWAIIDHVIRIEATEQASGRQGPGCRLLCTSTGFQPHERQQRLWHALYNANLKRLDLSGCVGLTALPNLDQLTNLQWLVLSGCVGLTALPNLDQLTNLQWLDLSGCVGLTALPNLDPLTNLQWLDLSGCVGLTALPNLDQLTNLQWLDLSGCVGLTALPNLDQLTNLQWLYLGDLKDRFWVPEALRAIVR